MNPSPTLCNRVTLDVKATDEGARLVFSLDTESLEVSAEESFALALKIMSQYPQGDEGWCFPVAKAGIRAHYFRLNQYRQVRSLCGQWRHFGDRMYLRMPDATKCRECSRIKARRDARAEASKTASK